jgi:hypothetical protein
MRSAYRPTCKIASHFCSRGHCISEWNLHTSAWRLSKSVLKHGHIKAVSKTMKKTPYPYAAPSLTIAELPACSLSVAYVNNSPALVATYCESVLAGPIGRWLVGRDIERIRMASSVKSDLLGKMYNIFTFLWKVHKAENHYLMGISFSPILQATKALRKHPYL